MREGTLVHGNACFMIAISTSDVNCILFGQSCATATDNSGYRSATRAAGTANLHDRAATLSVGVQWVPGKQAMLIADVIGK